MFFFYICQEVILSHVFKKFKINLSDMSGRYMKNFVVSHRTKTQDTEEQHHLVTRVKAGLSSDRYNHDYGKAFEQLKKYKLKSDEGKHKILKIQSQAESSHVHTIAKQHSLIWQSAVSTLDESINEIEEAYESSTLNFIKQCQTYDNEFAQEFLNCQSAVNNEVEKFEQAVILPINLLKDDLSYRIKNLSDPSYDANEEVLMQLDNVKQQNESVSDWLTQQRSILDEQLDDVKELKPKEESLIPLEEAVPFDILMEDNVNNAVRNSAIQMFIELYSRCKEACDNQTEKIHNLQSMLDGKMKSWNLFELWIFDKVTEIYKQHCPSHLRTKLTQLLPDMIRRLLDKSRWDVFEVSSIKVKIKFAVNARRSILSSFNRDFDSLKTKVFALFSETIESQKLAANKEAAKLEQQRYCSRLHEELEYFHTRQEEIRRLEHTLLERRRKVEEEEREAERRVIEQKRKDIRGKVLAYQQKKARIAQQSTAENERRLRELKLEMEKQRNRDQKRIKFRQNLYNQKLLVASELLRQKEEEEQEKARRLEAIRKMVAIEAPSDWSRLVQDTTASRAKAGKQEFDDDTALFKLHGYTGNQIKKDVRIRFEAAMREAGVHDTDYARHLMKSLAPPTQPRRDNDSSGFRSTFNMDN